MEKYSVEARKIIDELHKERLDYETEYLPLVNAVIALAELEEAETDGKLLQLKFKPGSIVWALEKDEYDVYYESPEGYIFLAECCGYAIVFIEFAISHKDIKHQIEQLYEACIDECGASVRLVPIEDVFSTREEAVEAYQKWRAQYA